MIKFYLNKLVRNKDLDCFKADNVVTHHRVITGNEFQQALKNKLVEEAQEVHDTQDINEITSELADIFDAAANLCKTYNIDMKDIERIQKEKSDKRGNYEKGIFIETIEMEETNPKAKHFRAQPQKYPEEKA